MPTYTWADVSDKQRGDILYIGGKRYRIKRKATTAICVERWYWWDMLWELLTATDK